MSTSLSNPMKTVISESRPEIVAEIVADFKSETRARPLLPWIFNVEGRFLGLRGKAPDNITDLVLAVEMSAVNISTAKVTTGELLGDDLALEKSETASPETITPETITPETITIELPQNLQLAVKQAVMRRTLKVGDRLRCIGRSQLDYAARVIQLRAYCFFLDDPSQTALSPTCQVIPKLAPAQLKQPPSHPMPLRSKQKILICHKSGCQKRGGRHLGQALQQALQQYQLQDRVEIQYTGCQKRCAQAPVLTIVPGNHRYDNLNLKCLPDLIEKHFCEL